MKKEIEHYLNAYCDSKLLKPYIQEFFYEESDMGLFVTVYCLFPECLIGRLGRLVKELSVGLSIHFNTTVKVEVLKFKNKQL